MGEEAQQSPNLEQNRGEGSFLPLQNLEGNEVQQQQQTALTFCSSFGTAQVMLAYVQNRDCAGGDIIFLMPCNKYFSFHPEDTSDHSQDILSCACG